MPTVGSAFCDLCSSELRLPYARLLITSGVAILDLLSNFAMPERVLQCSYCLDAG